jgi:hypothetical protein
MEEEWNGCLEVRGVLQQMGDFRNTVPASARRYAHAVVPQWDNLEVECQVVA